MPPQITCPHCGSTINLENRKEVDFEKILHALGKSPRTFTELLTMTNLPRKTLSLRLKELRASGSIMKDGGYHLNPSIVSANGTFSKRNGNGKMNPTILHIKKNVQWIPAVLIICLVVVAFGSAMIISPPAPAPAPTAANFYYIPSSNIVTGRDLTFVSASSGPITDYYWNFGDGSPIVNGKMVTHTYVVEGTYTVTLTVRDAHGLTTNTQETVGVSPASQPAKVIKFTISPDPTINSGWENKWVVSKPLTFDASAFNASTGFASNYSWNFGDGTTGTGVTVSHAYVENGTYTVTLNVADLEGAVQSVTQQVQILPMPAAKIFVEPLPSQYMIGDTITLKIVISDVTGLNCWGAGMTFNPSVLECITTDDPLNVAPNATTPTTAFTEGSFLKSGGSTVWIPNSVTNGMIGSCGCSILGPGTPVSGSGTLATVTFKVIGNGNLDIHLVEVCLIDINGSEIPVNVTT
ncbi:MAG TPA: PKD domain-containing protein [Candidatus Krumholzibacteriaceae bacterium]|nr:PKD domain-containing protein [Candidatus Krumholzibacteriaceae bacterium]